MHVEVHLWTPQPKHFNEEALELESISPSTMGKILIWLLFLLSCTRVGNSRFMAETEQIEGITHRMISVNGINMHIAEKGKGPVVLFIHGFPELWYQWRHQIVYMASKGYRAVAPDLRGYGDTDIPPSASNYTSLQIAGDLVALIDALVQDQVFVVGHDWGASIAWSLCLYRPDRVKALVALSVPPPRRNPTVKPLERFRATFGDDYYIVRFQKPGEIEAEIAEAGAATLVKTFLTLRNPGPLIIPRGQWLNTSFTLPPWLTEEDINYYASKFETTGFTGALNYYRAVDINWELTAAWTGAKVRVPAKFMVGDLDLVYNNPGNKEFVNGPGFKEVVPLLEEVIVMKGVGHYINEEVADEVNKEIYKFFNKF